MTNFQRVRSFHQKYKCWANSAPGEIPLLERLMRIRLITEELSELVKAMLTGDRVAIADGIADLLYVTYGTAVAYGIPIDGVFAEVHRSNMTKSMDKDAGGKVVKGEDFVEPKIEPFLNTSEWYYNTPKED